MKDQWLPLPVKWQKKVLEAELRITDIFIQAINELKDRGALPELDEATINLMGHNISVLGHTWTFRRWYYAKHFNVEQYIEQQTNFIMRSLAEKSG